MNGKKVICMYKIEFSKCLTTITLFYHNTIKNELGEYYTPISQKGKAQTGKVNITPKELCHK